METGPYFSSNSRKTANLTELEWKAALAKCKEHIKWRLKQKTLSGAHAASNLGANAVDHYLGLSYEKILLGYWEWKDEYTLGQQLIRIANSYISKEVEKTTSTKYEALNITYTDVEAQFYDLAAPPIDEVEQHEAEMRLKAIEIAVAGEEDLEFLVEGIKEGKKRSEIAELLGIGVRQLDKVREKLMRRMKNKASSQ